MEIETVLFKKNPRKKKKFRVVGDVSAKEMKVEIQSLLRQIALKRDKVCVLSHYPEAGACGGRKNNGELILQFDHLNSRAHSVSYGDPRLGVLVCQRHHIFWKRQYPEQYMRLIREHIGTFRCALLDFVQLDKTPHKVDWRIVILDLQQQLKNLE